MRIDVVVVAYGKWELTESCLRHLAAQTAEHRLIVVDNGSTDDTRARLAADWPAAHVVGFDDNQAFPRACNAGVAAGDGEVVVLLNNDVDCRPDFVERIAAPLREDPALGAVAAVCTAPGDERLDSVGTTVDVTLAGFQRLQGRPVAEASSDRPVLSGPVGTAAAYRRAAWEALGGLDERLRAYNEDLDLALRLRAAGWGTTAALDAVGTHLGSATFGFRSDFSRYHGGRGRGYLLRRYGVLRGRHAPRALATEAIVCAADLVLSRDARALRGRVAGWRAARGLPRHPPPPPEAIARDISFLGSLRLRRGPS